DCSDDDAWKWRTAGWWRLAPGETATVFGRDLQTIGPHYYFYAETADRLHVWRGPFLTCVPDIRFSLCLAACYAQDARAYVAPLRELGFRHVYVGRAHNYTVTLVRRR